MARAAKFELWNVEPRGDWVWDLSPEGVRRDYWREAVRLVKVAKDKDLAAGIDAKGKPLAPIKPYTRAHRKSAMGPPDPNAPPLTPAHGLSRTRAWFDGRAYIDHAEFFWRNAWGVILEYHRVGAGRLPVRDVIGLAPKSLAWVERNLAAWWAARKAQLAAPEQGQRFTFTPPSFAAVKKPEKIVPPPKIPVVGSLDFSQSTFGIGAGRETVERAAKAGYFTGFRALGGGLEGYGPSRPGAGGGAAARRLPRMGPGGGRAAARAPIKRKGAK